MGIDRKLLPNKKRKYRTRSFRIERQPHFDRFIDKTIIFHLDHLVYQRGTIDRRNLLYRTIAIE